MRSWLFETIKQFLAAKTRQKLISPFQDYLPLSSTSLTRFSRFRPKFWVKQSSRTFCVKRKIRFKLKLWILWSRSLIERERFVELANGEVFNHARIVSLVGGKQSSGAWVYSNSRSWNRSPLPPPTALPQGSPPSSSSLATMLFLLLPDPYNLLLCCRSVHSL